MIRRNKKTKIPSDKRHREQAVAMDLLRAMSDSSLPYGTALAGCGEEGQVFLLYNADWKAGMRTYRVVLQEIG